MDMNTRSANILLQHDSIDSHQAQRKANEYEWHSFITSHDIINAIQEVQQHPTFSSSVLRLLIIGCGNSGLPRHLYNHLEQHGIGGRKGHFHIQCLDFSMPCIRYLQNLHGDNYPKMSFVHGDATDLVGAIYQKENEGSKNHSNVNTSEEKYDVIIDKGLMDALMCGEGWDSSTQQLFYGASAVLKSDAAMYILISYKLSSSTKRFLEEVGSLVGLRWTFDIPVKSTEIASFSVARRCCQNKTHSHGLHKKL